MKRIVTILVAAAVLLGLASAPASASVDRVYPPPAGCQNLDIPSGSNPGWITYNLGRYQYGTFRIASGCGRSFTYYGDGLRSNNNYCVMVRLIVLGTDWVFDYFTRTVEVCGAGNATITDSRLRVNDRFYINAWASESRLQQPNDWPDGRAIF